MDLQPLYPPRYYNFICFMMVSEEMVPSFFIAMAEIIWGRRLSFMNLLTLAILYIIYRQCGGNAHGCLSGCAGLVVKLLIGLVIIAVLLGSCGATLGNRI